MSIEDNLDTALLNYWLGCQAAYRGNRKVMERHFSFFEQELSESIQRIFQHRVQKIRETGNYRTDYKEFWGKIRYDQ